ncbi:hypothetical protein E4K64_25405 [Bradyrhizobium frederickii]|uniref:Uncharacterized protein n=1 Tax=Bradyrhizobium frederickii TaxID=2560054 RepID=A0A4Y9NUI3_9BRAD|nr:hypothetical protein [Bradyrhizobium frederickii]TFV71669.1 hypothetical protein E4K64_25405 [Bradyrhizobium frederickii]
MSLLAQAPSAVSTTFTYTTGAAEANLYDGNDATAAADPLGLTINTKAAYDFGSAKAIMRCRAISAPANGFTNAATFNIEWSDTSLTAGFTTASTIVVPAGVSQAAISDFFVGSHRFWRISYSSGTTGGNAWLGELTFYTQSADPGAFTAAGNAAQFRMSEAASGASYAVTATGAVFKPSLAGSVGSFLETGNPALFSTSFAAGVSSYALSGLSAPLKIALAGNPADYAVTGSSVAFPIVFLTTVAAYAVTVNAATLTRDFVNWVQRPFDGDSWSGAAIQAETWSVTGTVSSSWSNAPQEADAWTSAPAASNTWTAK